MKKGTRPILIVIVLVILLLFSLVAFIFREDIQDFGWFIKDTIRTRREKKSAIF